MTDFRERAKGILQDFTARKLDGLSQPEIPFDVASLRTGFYNGLRERIAEKLDNHFSGNLRATLFSAVLTQMEKDQQGILAPQIKTGADLYNYLQINGYYDFSEDRVIDGSAKADLQGYGFDQMQRGIEQFRADSPEAEDKPKNDYLNWVEQRRTTAIMGYSAATIDVARAAETESYFGNKYFQGKITAKMSKKERDAISAQWNEINTGQEYQKVQAETGTVINAINHAGILVLTDALAHIETKTPSQRELSELEPMTRVFYIVFNELLNRMWWTS